MIRSAIVHPGIFMPHIFGHKLLIIVSYCLLKCICFHRWFDYSGDSAEGCAINEGRAFCVLHKQVNYLKPDHLRQRYHKSHFNFEINVHQALFTIDINGQMDEQVKKYLFGTLHKIIFLFLLAVYGLRAHINENEVVTIGP